MILSRDSSVNEEDLICVEVRQNWGTGPLLWSFYPNVRDLNKWPPFTPFFDFDCHMSEQVSFRANFSSRLRVTWLANPRIEVNAVLLDP